MGSKLVPTAIYALYILWDDTCSGPPVIWISTVNVYAVNLVSSCCKREAIHPVEPFALADEVNLTEKEHMIIHLNPLLRVSWNPPYHARHLTFISADIHVALFDAISRRTLHRLSNYVGNHNLTVLVCLDLEENFSMRIRGDNPITLLADFYCANTKYLDEIPRVVMGVDNGVAECPKMGSSIPHNDPICALEFLKYVTPSILLHPVHRAIVLKSMQKTPSDPIEGPHPRDPIDRMVNYGVES